MILIEICVFSMRLEEHKVLFIIAVISTIEMTIGPQLKAAPRCSSLYWPAVVTPELFALGNKFNVWTLLHLHQANQQWLAAVDKDASPSALALPHQHQVSWGGLGSLSLPQGLSLPCSDSTARMGTPFFFCETWRDPIICSASEAGLLYKHLKRKKTSTY